MIQGLVHTPKIVNWLENHHSRCHEGECLACALGRFSMEYWEAHQSDDGYNFKERKRDEEDDESESMESSDAGMRSLSLLRRGIVAEEEEVNAIMMIIRGAWLVL